MSALSLLLLVAGCLLAVPGAVFCGEVAAALLLSHGRRTRPPPTAARPALAVVVPAHDEERHLPATLRSVRAQLRPGDRLVALVLDRTVPPLTLRVLAEAALAGLGAVLLLSGGSDLPLTLGLAALIALTVAVAAAWIAERGAVAVARPSALLSDLTASLALVPRLLSPRLWVRSDAP